MLSVYVVSADALTPTTSLVLARRPWRRRAVRAAACLELTASRSAIPTPLDKDYQTEGLVTLMLIGALALLRELKRLS